MADMTTMDAMELVRKHLEAAGEDQLRELVKLMAEGLMDAEAQAQCGAQYGMPSAERINPAQRLPQPPLGHASGQHRAGRAEAATRQLLPGVAVASAQAQRAALMGVVAGFRRVPYV